MHLIRVTFSIVLIHVLSTCTAQQIPYGARGEFFNATEMNTVLAAAKQNIRAVAAQPFVSAGVSMKVSHTHPSPF